MAKNKYYGAALIRNFIHYVVILFIHSTAGSWGGDHLATFWDGALVSKTFAGHKT